MMLPGARMFFERRGAPTPPLPYDYAVEYIETDGVASYIDTGITPELSTYKVVTRFQVISVANPSQTSLAGNNIFGAASGANPLFQRMSFIGRPSDAVFRTQSPNLSSSPYPVFDNNIHDISFDSTALVFDGTPHAVNATTNTCGHLCLGTRGSFPASTNPQNFYTQTRFYGFKIYDGDNHVFDGIPVVANGLAGLYDSISGTVKTNAAATGTITAGPRV